MTDYTIVSPTCSVHDISMINLKTLAQKINNASSHVHWGMRASKTHLSWYSLPGTSLRRGDYYSLNWLCPAQFQSSSE